MEKFLKRVKSQLKTKVSKVILLSSICIVMFSCKTEKKRAVFYDSGLDVFVDSFEFDNNNNIYKQIKKRDMISIPYVERGGVKYVNVSVNGLGFEMIFDTGCSGTLISVAEANYLYQKGFLMKDDILGVAQSQIADGSIVENMIVNLNEVVIDGKIRCLNVKATVSSNNNAPLLLGNEVLNRVASYSVDNENKTINFKLK